LSDQFGRIDDVSGTKKRSVKIEVVPEKCEQEYGEQQNQCTDDLAS
jgi:hypothetical protein